MIWFSGTCTRVLLVSGKGAVSEERSVYVFRAPNRRAALRRLKSIATQEDREYTNGLGQRVRLAAASLNTLDELTNGPLRDREVYSEWRKIRPRHRSMPFDRRFKLDTLTIGSSGVALLDDIPTLSRQLERRVDAERKAVVTRRSRSTRRRDRNGN